jgi:hypothetical protein
MWRWENRDLWRWIGKVITIQCNVMSFQCKFIDFNVDCMELWYPKYPITLESQADRATYKV